jgi:hypothetical protein
MREWNWMVMESWTPLQVFFVLMVGTFLAGMGGYARANKTATIREMLAAGAYWSALSTSVCMMGYEFIGGREKPWRVLGTGVLIALGIIGADDIKRIVQSVIGGKNGQ